MENSNIESNGNNRSDGNNRSSGNNRSDGNNRSSGNNWSNGNNRSSGNNCSSGNSWSNGNNRSDGNNCSSGNNWSNGNNCSSGNSWSNGNNRSDGNSCSNGNNWSDGNNRSSGNNWSNGNNWSDGNNCSSGNNWSFFNSKVLGSHKSIFCHDEKGICFKAFNQQLDEEKVDELSKKIREAVGKNLPYCTDYQSRLELGWHKKHDEANEFVKQICDDDETNEKLYHEAWKLVPKSVIESVIAIIKSSEHLDTEKALEVFTKVTGISTKAEPVEEKAESLSGTTCKVTIGGKEYEAVIK